MANFAHIGSLDALRQFRVALIKYAESINVALDEAETEVQRTDMWIKQEQPIYWKQQLALRTELYGRAKSALNRKKMESSAIYF